MGYIVLFLLFAYKKKKQPAAAVSLVSLGETDRLGGTVAGHPSSSSPCGLGTLTGEAEDQDDRDLMNCCN